MHLVLLQGVLYPVLIDSSVAQVRECAAWTPLVDSQDAYMHYYCWIPGTSDCCFERKRSCVKMYHSKCLLSQMGVIQIHQPAGWDAHTEVYLQVVPRNP